MSLVQTVAEAFGGKSDQPFLCDLSLRAEALLMAAYAEALG